MAWMVLNEVTGRKSDSPPARLQGSVDERKEKWKDYFCNLLGQPPKVPDDNFDITPVIDHVLPIEEGPFTLQELNEALKSTKRGGAVGVDSIPLEIWESPQFSSYLLELCNIGQKVLLNPFQRKVIHACPIIQE